MNTKAFTRLATKYGSATVAIRDMTGWELDLEYSVLDPGEPAAPAVNVSLASLVTPYRRIPLELKDFGNLDELERGISKEVERARGET